MEMKKNVKKSKVQINTHWEMDVDTTQDQSDILVVIRNLPKRVSENITHQTIIGYYNDSPYFSR